jgi:hypothetical protein
VQQVDDRLQTVVSASGQGAIPERPVVMTRFGLAQTPRRAVANNRDSEGGNRPEVVVDVGVVATLRELVLAMGSSIGKHQRIGPLLAHRPGEVRESSIVGVRVRHRCSNLVEPRRHTEEEAGNHQGHLALFIRVGPRRASSTPDQWTPTGWPSPPLIELGVEFLQTLTHPKCITLPIPKLFRTRYRVRVVVRIMATVQEPAGHRFATSDECIDVVGSATDVRERFFESRQCRLERSHVTGSAGCPTRTKGKTLAATTFAGTHRDPPSKDHAPAYANLDNTKAHFQHATSSSELTTHWQ